MDKVKILSQKVFEKDPYSPLLRDIWEFRLDYLSTYPSETVNTQDKPQFLLKIREWQKNSVDQQG